MLKSFLLLTLIFILCGFANISESNTIPQASSEGKLFEPLQPLTKPNFVLGKKTMPVAQQPTSQWRSIEEIANLKKNQSQAQTKIKSINKPKASSPHVGSIVCRQRHSFIDQGKIKDIRGNRAQVHITSIYLKDRPTPKFNNRSDNIIWDTSKNWLRCSENMAKNGY